MKGPADTDVCPMKGPADTDVCPMKGPAEKTNQKVCPKNISVDLNDKNQNHKVVDLNTASRRSIYTLPGISKDLSKVLVKNRVFSHKPKIFTIYCFDFYLPFHLVPNFRIFYFLIITCYKKGKPDQSVLIDHNS